MEDLDKLANGVKLEDGKTAPADVYLDSIIKYFERISCGNHYL